MSFSVENRARIVFVLLLLFLAAGAAGAWLFARGRHNLYEIRSPDNVSGLIAGAPVEFHGVDVGKVDEVQLIDPHHVRIVVAVRKDVPVTTATVATITGRGLAARGFTGYVYVSLEESGGQRRPLGATAGDLPMIANAPSRAESLDTSIGQLNDNVQAAVGLLRTTLDARTIASLQQSAANLEAVSRTLAANNARMQAILLDAQRATAQMPPLVQAGMQTLREVQTGLLPQAGGTLTRIGGVTDQMQDTLMVTRTQLLPEAQQTAERLDELSGALADTADRIRRNPALLVRGTRPRPGPGEAP